jgi:hypothetical protein
MPDVGKITGSISFKDEASKALTGFTKKLKGTTIGWKQVAVGAAAAGAAIAASIHAYDTQVNSINQLNLALANQGSFSAEASKRIQELASAQQNLTTFGDEATLAAAASGAQMGMNADQIEQMLPLVQDYAAAMGKDLKVAFMDVGKSMAGQVSSLARYGVKTNEAMSETERMAIVVEGLTSKFGGSAALQAETFAGKLTQIKNAAGDVLEQIGSFLNFLLGSFGGGVDSTLSLLTSLGDFFGKTLPTVVSEAKAQFAGMLASLFETGAAISEFLGKIPGLSEVLPSPELLNEMAKGQRNLAKEVRDEADAFIAAGIQGRDFANVVGGPDGIAGAATKATEEVSEFTKMTREWAVEAKLAAEQAELAASAMDFSDVDFEPPSFDFLGMEGPGTLGAVLDESIEKIGIGMVSGVGDVEYATEKVIERQEEYNQSLQNAANLAKIIPGILGDIVSQTISAVSAMKSLSGGGGIGGIFGGIKDAFTKGAGGKGGIMGTLSGIMGAAGPMGQMLSVGLQMGGMMLKGIKKLFSIGGPDIARDVARDMGPKISEELEKSIVESGRPAQLAIAKIFEEGFASGTATADMLAEEIGDLFSFFERGEITEPEIVAALEESIPMLISRLQELGPAGEEQLQRIIGAAQNMGIEFEGLSELIQGTFAPDTLEDMMEKFGMTNEEVRELADQLGINLQTNLEKMAATIGMSVDDFKALGAAVEEKFGIPMEDIEGLMASMGVSAEELAAALGVEVTTGAGELEDELVQNTEEMGRGADEANRLADALERAARASSGIVIPSSGVPTAGMQHGGITAGPQFTMIGEGGPEVVAPVAALFGELGDELAKRIASGADLKMEGSTYNIQSNNPEEIMEYIEANEGNSMERLFRRAKEGGHTI